MTMTTTTTTTTTDDDTGIAIPMTSNPTSRPPDVGVVDAVDVGEVAASRTATTPTTAIPVTIRTTGEIDSATTPTTTRR